MLFKNLFCGMTYTKARLWATDDTITVHNNLSLPPRHSTILCAAMCFLLWSCTFDIGTDWNHLFLGMAYKYETFYFSHISTLHPNNSGGLWGSRLCKQLNKEWNSARMLYGGKCSLGFEVCILRPSVLILTSIAFQMVIW